MLHNINIHFRSFFVTGLFICMLLALDISTTTLGYSVFSYNKELKEYGFIDLSKETGLYKKLDKVKETISRLILDYNIKDVIVEDCIGATGINTNTVNLLIAFNYMIDCFIYCGFNIQLERINVRFARKKVIGRIARGSDAKEMVFDKICSLYPSMNWPKNKLGKRDKRSLDISDSILIGLAYLIR